MTQARKKSELTPEERVLYLEAYFAAVDTLIVAQSKLSQLERITSDLGARSRYRADGLRIEADIELLRARRIAFNADDARVNPPSQETVDRAIAMAKDVANEQVDRNRAEAIVKFATKAMTEFSNIHKG